MAISVQSQNIINGKHSDETGKSKFVELSFCFYHQNEY